MARAPEWFRHAFAIDPPGPAEPTDAQRQVVDRICREIVRRRLTTPAQMLIEMSRPLNFVSAQMLHFFQPFATVLADAAAYDEFTTFLERRGALDYIAGRLDALEHESATDSRRDASL
jgi:hypothetical protein